MHFIISNLIVKIWKKMYFFLKKLQFKLLYGKKIIFGKRLSVLKGFKLVIGNKGRVIIGDGCFFNYNCSISCLGNIEIGNNTIFGENVKFYDHNHDFSDINQNIKDQGFKIGKITIGNNCWIGSNVTILNNVTIGDNVIIGANCLVYKSIPSNTIVKNKSELIYTQR
ncbi:acyltransferase [Niallia sp. Man26]|uniref:acyltransferase n=1 Tax=Niallia sp. Man26 TaxID=2912824 RepID=UPI001EDB739B|nr:acyltransferase [Niallia sp. Man26]UPO87337.1 acyltransferase [Niallia sp. Man26]